MKTYIKNVSMGVLLGFSLCYGNVTYAAEQVHESEVVSTNVPLDNYTYDYLDKLDGMGYITDMRIGMKPYTRVEVAKWVLEAEQNVKEKPSYIQGMIKQLKVEYADEIKFLDGQAVDSELKLKEWNFGISYYDGDSVANTASKSFYQPLNINNNGYKFADGFNMETSVRVEKSLDHHIVFSLEPTFRYDKEDNGSALLKSGYVKTKFNNVEVSIGKDALWWGQGKRGTLALSNNAKPMTYLKFSNIEPMHWSWFKGLGDIYSSVFYSEIDDMRKFDGTTIDNPGFIGARMDFVPNDRFTFGISRTSITDKLNSHDIKDFIMGENAADQEVDKWNSIAGIDFRWRIPHKSQTQIYGELYGEDQSHELGFIPFPSKKGYTFGIYLPKLSEDGKWEANLEYGQTSNVWYNHWVFTDGYVNGGNIIGDAMGNNAKRYYLGLTRFIDEKNQVSIHAERLDSDEVNLGKHNVDSIWISGKSKLEENLFLEYLGGVSKIDKDTRNDKNYRASFIIRKYY